MPHIFTAVLTTFTLAMLTLNMFSHFFVLFFCRVFDCEFAWFFCWFFLQKRNVKNVPKKQKNKQIDRNDFHQNRQITKNDKNGKYSKFNCKSQ